MQKDFYFLILAFSYFGNILFLCVSFFIMDVTFLEEIPFLNQLLCIGIAHNSKCFKETQRMMVFHK